MTQSEDLKTLRAGANAIREEWGDVRGSGWSKVQEFYLAVADMLDAEAATLGSIGPFTELLSALIENDGGPLGYLKVSKKENGDPLVHSDTSPASVRVARVFLDGGIR